MNTGHIHYTAWLGLAQHKTRINRHTFGFWLKTARKPNESENKRKTFFATGAHHQLYYSDVAHPLASQRNSTKIYIYCLFAVVITFLSAAHSLSLPYSNRPKKKPDRKLYDEKLKEPNERTNEQINEMNEKKKITIHSHKQKRTPNRLRLFLRLNRFN